MWASGVAVASARKTDGMKPVIVTPFAFTHTGIPRTPSRDVSVAVERHAVQQPGPYPVVGGAEAERAIETEPVVRGETVRVGESACHSDGVAVGPDHALGHTGRTRGEEEDDRLGLDRVVVGRGAAGRVRVLVEHDHQLVTHKPRATATLERHAHRRATIRRPREPPAHARRDQCSRRVQWGVPRRCAPTTATIASTPWPMITVTGSCGSPPAARTRRTTCLVTRHELGVRNLSCVVDDCDVVRQRAERDLVRRGADRAAGGNRSVSDRSPSKCPAAPRGAWLLVPPARSAPDNIASGARAIRSPQCKRRHCPRDDRVVLRVRGSVDST